MRRGIGHQGADKDQLWRAVVPVVAVSFGKSAGASKLLPSGSPVTGPPESGAVDKSFGKQDGMTMASHPVTTEPFQIHGEES